VSQLAEKIAELAAVLARIVEGRSEQEIQNMTQKWSEKCELCTEGTPQNEDG